MNSQKNITAYIYGWILIKYNQYFFLFGSQLSTFLSLRTTTVVDKRLVD
jgi:hypothetical protein